MTAASRPRLCSLLLVVMSQTHSWALPPEDEVLRQNQGCARREPWSRIPPSLFVFSLSVPTRVMSLGFSFCRARSGPPRVLVLAKRELMGPRRQRGERQEKGTGKAVPKLTPAAPKTAPSGVAVSRPH